MSIVIHVNKFILQRNRSENRNDPAYCVHGSEATGYAFIGRYLALRGNGEFTFAESRQVPIPEPDTEAGATHVMVLGPGCEVWGLDEGYDWLPIARAAGVIQETTTPMTTPDANQAFVDAIDAIRNIAASVDNDALLEDLGYEEHQGLTYLWELSEENFDLDEWVDVSHLDEVGLEATRSAVNDLVTELRGNAAHLSVIAEQLESVLPLIKAAIDNRWARIEYLENRPDDDEEDDYEPSEIGVEINGVFYESAASQ